MIIFLKIFAIILIAVNAEILFASNLHQSLSASLGMVSVNVTENASSLKSTDESSSSSTSSGGQSATASVISMDLVYEFDNYTRKSYFVKATAPLLAADGSGFYLGAVGMNYYFNSLSSLFSFNDEGTSLIMNPTMRYYWGAAGGIGFVVYSTETAKKSDLIFDVQIHGGGIFNFKRDWGLRGEAAISRGTGVATSTIGIKLFLGINYYLEK
jgi:hypothetical protein